MSNTALEVIRWINRVVSAEPSRWDTVSQLFSEVLQACINGGDRYSGYNTSHYRLIFQHVDAGGLGMPRPKQVQWQQASGMAIRQLNKRPEFKNDPLLPADCADFMGHIAMKTYKDWLGSECTRRSQGKSNAEKKLIWKQVRSEWKPVSRNASQMRMWKRQRSSPILCAGYNNPAEKVLFAKAAKTPFKNSAQCIVQPVRHLPPGQWRHAVKVHFGLEQPVRKNMRLLKLYWKKMGLTDKMLEHFYNIGSRKALMKQLSMCQRAVISRVHVSDVCRLSEEMYAERVLANISEYSL